MDCTSVGLSFPLEYNISGIKEQIYFEASYG